MSQSIIEKAVAYHNSGNLERAEKLYIKVLKQRPSDVQLHYLLGILYGQSGKFKKSVHWLSLAVGFEPENNEYLTKYGYALIHNEQYQQAIDALEKAIASNVNSPESFNNLALAHIGLKNYDAAIDNCQRSLELDPGYLQARYNLARSYHACARDELAVEQYVAILDLKPDHASALLELGNVSQQSGQFENAKSYFQRCIAADPSKAEAYLHLSDLLEKDHLPRLDESINVAKGQQTGPEGNVLLDFAQARLYSRLGEMEKSFKSVHRGNNRRDSAVPYDSRLEERQIESIRTLFTAEYTKDMQHSGCGYDDESAIFIVGMPRSGTTLVESILAAHTQVVAAGELSILHGIIRDRQLAMGMEHLYQALQIEQEGYEIIGRQYIKDRNHRVKPEPGQWVTDKYPHNFLHIGLIKLALPKAKIIHCRRNAADTCLSVYSNYFSGALRYAFNMKNVAHFYSLYYSVMAYWDAVFKDIYHIDYEALVADQESQTRQVLEYLGLPWDENCLSFYEQKHKIRTVSSMQARQPVYQSSANRWKKSAEYIAPLLAELDRLGIQYR